MSQLACDRCTQGVMDTTNPHYLGTCSCPCHRDITDSERVVSVGDGARERETYWFCLADGYSPTNKGGWCDLGCGSDYNRMIGVPGRHIEKLVEAEFAAARRETAQARERLLQQADKYEKDGEPGPLGFNCWGWRDIARTLREEAAALAVVAENEADEEEA